jgi:hypothetical protein
LREFREQNAEEKFHIKERRNDMETGKIYNEELHIYNTSHLILLGWLNEEGRYSKCMLNLGTLRRQG